MLYRFEKLAAWTIQITTREMQAVTMAGRVQNSHQERKGWARTRNRNCCKGSWRWRELKAEWQRRKVKLYTEGKRKNERLITWTKLLDSSVVTGRVDRQEVLEPGNLRVRVAAGSTEHSGGPRALNYLQLRTHIYGGEARGQLVF